MPVYPVSRLVIVYALAGRLWYSQWYEKQSGGLLIAVFLSMILYTRRFGLRMSTQIGSIS